jgi:ABC-type glycerol-3-phosphate transport system permease component
MKSVWDHRTGVFNMNGVWDYLRNTIATGLIEVFFGSLGAYVLLRFPLMG